MDIREYIDRFRAMALWKRWSMLAILAILPALYDLWDSGQILIEERDIAEQNRVAADAAFTRAKEKKAQLPKLEKELAQTQAEMASARKALPDEFYMDQILEKTSILADDSGVRLLAFDPGEGRPSNTAFKYVELPVTLDVIGSYSQIVAFYDRLVHLDLLVHVRDFHFAIHSGEKEKPDSGLSAENQQILIRQNTKLSATCKMVLFRTLSDQEAQAIEEKEKDRNKPQAPTELPEKAKA